MVSKVSIIIPSRNETFLSQTVNDLLTKATGDIEIIVVLDGYWPSFDIREDPRVRYIHLGKNRGMRGAINAGVSVARGEFLCRSDEHVMVAKGFDRIMTETCKKNWILTARRYFLDPKQWKVMEEEGYVDYEKLVIQGKEGDIQKFAGQKWRSRDKSNAHKMVDQTMAMQGSCWVMPRQLWIDVIGELQTEGYGPLYQDSHEMIFKVWQAGGKMVLCKNTWFAHKHRSFSRTHNYGTAEAAPGWKYSLDTWRDFYETKVRKVWGI